MNEDNRNFEKKKELFSNQKRTLDTFLSTGAISRAQYDKSFGDLVRLMGMEEVVGGAPKGAPDHNHSE